MKRRELLAETTTPDGLRLTLTQHDRDYYIDIDGAALMSTRAPGSEKAMAEIAARELAGNPTPRVLIGGLGMSFTLGAALDTLPPGATVVVVEFFDAIVDWNQKFDFESDVNRLADPRVIIEVTNVVEYLRRVKQPFDAILLDVDNGPDALTLASNTRLYDRHGLLEIQNALNPGGVLLVWSAAASPIFEDRLSDAGYVTHSETVRSRATLGDHHTIFVAQLPVGAKRRGNRPAKA